MTDKKKTPPDNTGKKYDLTITDKQIKFIDLYCSKYGELSATDCAIRAGYSRTSAYQRAHELLNPRLSPATAKIIQDRLQGNMEVWLIDKEKHLANLHRIQQDAKAKGQYGVAGKMEELKGKVQGFYVERNLNLNVELSIGIKEAIKILSKNNNSITLCLGSLYLVGEILNLN